MLGDCVDAVRVHLMTAEVRLATANCHGLGLDHGSGRDLVCAVGYLGRVKEPPSTLKRHAAASDTHAFRREAPEKNEYLQTLTIRPTYDTGDSLSLTCEPG